MADIFLTKQNVDPVTGAVSYYYEIYAQKLIDNQERYCLIQVETVPANLNGEMPLLDFGDLDRDAMTDMIFYANGSLHTYYNMY